MDTAPAAAAIVAARTRRVIVEKLELELAERSHVILIMGDLIPGRKKLISSRRRQCLRKPVTTAWLICPNYGL